MPLFKQTIAGACVVTAALAVGLAGGAAPASADGPQLAISPSAAAPGSSITIAGGGFQAFETVNLYWNGSPVGALPASAGGAVSFPVHVVSWAPPGTRTVVLQGSAGDRATGTFTILSAGGSEPTPTPPPSSPTPTPTPPAPPTPTPPGIPGSGSTSNGCQITATQASAEQYLFARLNQDRAAAGAAPLQLDETISLASRQHSCDMFEHQQLTHIGSDGSSPFQRIAAVGVSFSTTGENIGLASGYDATDGVAVIDDEMMAEPLSYGDHHWNIVNAAYTHVGIGVIYANGQVWVTEDFTG